MRRMFDALTTSEPHQNGDGSPRDKVTGRLQLVLVIAFILFALLLSSLLSSTSRAPRIAAEDEFSPLVASLKVQPVTRQIEITGSGAVKARVTVGIVPQVQGRITSLSAAMQPGGEFVADEALFQIEATDFELEVERLKSEVASARTALQLEEAEGIAATREWEAINPGEPVPDLVARKPQIRDKKAALTAAEARWATAKLNLERTTFSLPFTGRVVTSNIERGQFVAAGQSFGTAYPLDALEVAVPLADTDLKWLQPLDNVSATITTSYLGRDVTINAASIRVGAELDARTRFANVIVSLPSIKEEEPNAAASLVPGVFVEVTFKGPALDNVFALPTSAIQENGTVWLIEEGRLKEAKPDIVQTGPSETLVRGLENPSEVMTSHLAGSLEGMSVRTQRDPASTNTAE